MSVGRRLCTPRAGEGVTTAKTLAPFALRDDTDAIAEMRVPEGLRTLSVAFRGAVRTISRGGTKQTVEANETFTSVAR